MSKQIILKDLPTTKSILFSKEFRKDYLDFADNEILLEQPVLILDLLFQIISDLRDNIFLDTGNFMGKDNQMKMDYWNTEFVGDERNEIRKVYNVSQFLKNRSKEQITEALQFLKLFKNEKYTFENKAGVKITTSGGLIKDWFFAEKSGNFEVVVSLYWANKIVALQTYNQLFLEVIKKFSSTKQRFFLLWLLEINEKGTSVLVGTIQSAFNLNYKNNYEFVRGFLTPIKLKLDKENLGISFNYSFDDKNSNLLHIITYPNKPENELIITNNSISYKLIYIKRRHKLSNTSAALIRKIIEKDYYLFEKNYKEFLINCKAEKKIATDYLNEDFLKKFLKTE